MVSSVLKVVFRPMQASPAPHSNNKDYGNTNNRIKIAFYLIACISCDETVRYAYIRRVLSFHVPRFHAIRSDEQLRCQSLFPSFRSHSNFHIRPGRVIV